MAERKEITVRATKRDGRGKNDARRVRRDGLVPVTVYGGDGEAVSAVAPIRDLAAILRSDTGYNTIFTIDVEGIGASEVMFHDRQIDPVRGRLVHADLKRLVKGQKIEVTVHVHLIGEPVGVREEQGVLDGRVVLGHAGGEQRLEDELRVGQVGALALAVVGDAAEGQ